MMGFKRSVAILSLLLMLGISNAEKSASEFGRRSSRRRRSKGKGTWKYAAGGVVAGMAVSSMLKGAQTFILRLWKKFILRLWKKTILRLCKQAILRGRKVTSTAWKAILRATTSTRHDQKIFGQSNDEGFANETTNMRANARAM